MIPLSVADYYDFFPTREHNPGDIWVDLPTFGTLPQSHLAGLVVTPACDLSNRKVETITYVPIVPVNQYVTSSSLGPEIKRATEGQLVAADLKNLLDLPEGYERVPPAQIDTAVELLKDRSESPKIPSKVKLALSRALGGLRLLRAVTESPESPGDVQDLVLLLGERAFGDLIKRIITNARSDLHFLPADEQKPDWSGVPVHSLALFRYPLTLPLEVLDIAQNVTEADWAGAVKRVRRIYPCVELMPVRPMKRVRLLPGFASDLVTRYTAMFGRLGSPDFTADTVARFQREIEGR